MTNPKRDIPTRKQSQANFVSDTIWTGDNLEIMRGMNSESVDLIYLDPPFNSNKDYSAPIGSEAAGAAFKDTWTLSDVDVHEHGELADRNPAAYSVIEAARQAHGKSMQSYLIFMAVRLIEMHRILKQTGSIYLHCDPTASHYLKLLMDGIFSANCHKNEIIWERTLGRSDAKRFARVHDVILYYANGDNTKWNGCWIPLTREQIQRDYRYEDEFGKFQPTSLTTQGLSGGGYYYDFHGKPGPWRFPEHSMRELEQNGKIWLSQKMNSWPRYKRYLLESKGVAARDVIADIKPASRNERTGYPTQKPLALLDRIIKASSNPDDMVFDPFCGCATTLVAADRLQRQWIGIDLSPLAIKLVNERITEDRGSLFGGVTALDAPPLRTDLGKLPNYRTHRHRLYGEQEGICIGCDTHFPFRVMDVDHILPKSRGGTDHLDNLQLLCSGCNRSKGGKTMAEWRTIQ